MKTNGIPLVLFLILNYVLSGCSEHEKKCFLKGEVDDNIQSKALLLTKAYGDIEFSDAVRIPIVNGEFKHEIQFKYPEAYYLEFEEEYSNNKPIPIIFFLTEGDVNIKIGNTEGTNTSIVVGGEDNRKYSEYSKSIQSSYEIYKTDLKYMKEVSIFSYFLLVSNLRQYTMFGELYDINRLKELQKQFAEEYPKHPYTAYCKNMLWNIENIQVGKGYYDFVLPDLNGNNYRISEIIDGKCALIDIWAPWCGSCIAKSIKMKEVYEEFKNKGFTVVGIASKYKKLSNVELAIKKHGFPWQTLIDKPELESNLNELYGITNAGGGTFLIDENGKILAIHPSAQEVKDILQERYR